MEKNWKMVLATRESLSSRDKFRSRRKKRSLSKSFCEKSILRSEIKEVSRSESKIKITYLKSTLELLSPAPKIENFTSNSYLRQFNCIFILLTENQKPRTSDAGAIIESQTTPIVNHKTTWEHSIKMFNKIHHYKVSQKAIKTTFQKEHLLPRHSCRRSETARWQSQK